MSAASILPQAAETAIVQRSNVGTIEQQFRAWEVDFYTGEAPAKVRSTALWRIYQAWARENLSASIAIDAFLDYAATLNISVPRSTLRRRVRVGFSLTRLPEEQTSRMTLEQLDDAYDLILAGEGSEGVAQAVEEKSLERKAKHARTKGLDFLPLPKEYAEIRKELRSRFAQIEEPELIGLAVQFAHTFHAEFVQFVKVES